MAENLPNTTAPTLEEVIDGLSLQHTTFTTETRESIPQGVGTFCQTKILYEGRSKCSCCINWVEQYPEDTKDSVEQTSDTKRYAILCRVKKSHGPSKRPLELHSLVIQSPLLKTILGTVFAQYPEINTKLEEVEFSTPFWEFFYCWDTLTETQDTCEPDASNLIRLLLKALTYQLGDVHRIAKDLVQNNVTTYDFLWVLFPSRTIVFSRLFGQDCLLEVRKTKYTESPFGPIYILKCRYIDWDAEKFGWKKKEIKIDSFSGTRAIQGLEVYPVAHHKAPADIKSRLLKRGRKFVSLSNWQPKAYRGIIWVTGNSLFGSNKLQINERIVVDAKAFSQHVRSLESLSPLDDDSILRPEDASSHPLLILCSAVVEAYALKAKCWGEVLVDGISEIQWDENAFRNLVLEEETKKLIESFVLAQLKQSSLAFDDIIEGKGQGLILLLTGEPGVGKTLTAETVAEKAHRPLYMIGAGEIGTSGSEVEAGLTKILDLAYRWNAVLLLDESDVFLEQRTSDNLERNQLVSVFLRMLEYYRGILFLTTNRVTVFDVAFQSRIHLTLHYHGLNRESRQKIWEVLLSRAQADIDISKEDLDNLAEEPLNGRQIKNAVKAAALLASADGVILAMDHIKIVLRVMAKSQSPTEAPTKNNARRPRPLGLLLSGRISRWAVSMARSK